MLKITPHVYWNSEIFVLIQENLLQIYIHECVNDNFTPLTKFRNNGFFQDLKITLHILLTRGWCIIKFVPRNQTSWSPAATPYFVKYIYNIWVTPLNMFKCFITIWCTHFNTFKWSIYYLRNFCFVFNISAF